MEKLNTHSPDFTAQNVAKLAELFPNCVTESKDDKGNLRNSIDFDLLKQELSADIVEGPKERYRLDWPGKREALITANTPITKTLRPHRGESVDFDTTQNLFIEGDNLDALKLLQEIYLGKVKVIYIDPPYNTGNDILYKNDYSLSEDEYHCASGQKWEGIKAVANLESNGRFHSDWLSMMYARLKLARSLLSDKGFITITIDHNELHSLITICDEIFGIDNKVGIVAIRNNPAGRSTAKGVSITHEYAVIYSKTDKAKLCRLPRNQEQIDRYDQEDEISKFEWVNFRKPGSKKIESPKMFYPIFVSDNGPRIPEVDWNPIDEEWTLKERLTKDEAVVYPIDDDGNLRRWRWSIAKARQNIHELKPKFLKDKWAVNLKARIPNEGVLPNTWWDKKEYSSTAYGTNLMKSIFGELQIFSYPKSIYAVVDSLKIMSDEKDCLIIDFFAGSSTTAHAVMQLNAEDGGRRKFIMVQLPENCDEKSEALKAGYENIAEISRERIRRAGEEIKHLNAEVASDLDIGFRVLKIDSSNMVDIENTPDVIEQGQLQNLIENIKPNRTPEDLLFQVLLNWGVDLTLPITSETVEGLEVFFVDGNALVACFAPDGQITENLCKELATRKPLRVVFRDSGFENDSVKVNVEQIFKLLSPGTDVKTI